jgi:hypothetical protein
MQVVVIISLAWNLWRVLGIKIDRDTPGTPESELSIGGWKTSGLAIIAFAPFFLPLSALRVSLSGRRRA